LGFKPLPIVVAVLRFLAFQPVAWNHVSEVAPPVRQSAIERGSQKKRERVWPLPRADDPPPDMIAAARIFSTARDIQGVCSTAVTAVAKDPHGFRATLSRSAALRYALAPSCIVVALLVQVSISGPVPEWSQLPPLI